MINSSSETINGRSMTVSTFIVVRLRALRSNPKISIHLGEFRSDVRQMPLHPWQYDESGQPITVKVRKTEEKGSDVNLATHLVADALRNSADAYVVVSNDSDLVGPIRYLVHEIGVVVGLIMPSATLSKALVKTQPTIIRLVKAEAPTEVGVSRPASRSNWGCKGEHSKEFCDRSADCE